MLLVREHAESANLGVRKHLLQRLPTIASIRYQEQNARLMSRDKASAQLVSLEYRTPPCTGMGQESEDS